MSVTAEVLCEKYSKEQLAETLISITKSLIAHLDNGCGNDLNFDNVINSHLPKEKL